MLIRITEAKSKTCHRVPHGFPCIGDKCMAWRWGEAAKRAIPRSVDAGKGFTVEPTRPATVGPDWIWHSAVEDQKEFWSGWREPQASAQERANEFNNLARRGYCGLVGSPEEEA